MNKEKRKDRKGREVVAPMSTRYFRSTTSVAAGPTSMRRVTPPAVLW